MFSLVSIVIYDIYTYILKTYAESRTLISNMLLLDFFSVKLYIELLM